MGELHAESSWPRDETLLWPLPRDRMLGNDADYYRLDGSRQVGRHPSGVVDLHDICTTEAKEAPEGTSRCTL
jgi:hypothetical protein